MPAPNQQGHFRTTIAIPKCVPLRSLATVSGSGRLAEAGDRCYMLIMPRRLLFFALVDLGGCTATIPVKGPMPFRGRLPQLPPGATPPEVRDAARPIYPEAALYRGIQGCAWVKFDIPTQGHPFNIVPVSSVPVSNFGPAAVATLRKWRFVPARSKATRSS